MKKKKYYLCKPNSSDWQQKNGNFPWIKYFLLFKQANVLDYIEKAYGIFHCEGDEAVLQDIEEYLDAKGLKIHA